MRFWWPWGARTLAVVALAVAVIGGVPAVREPVLRAAGWALVVKEPVAPADIIVVSLDSGGVGVLEAAELVQSGIATRVAVFADDLGDAGTKLSELLMLIRIEWR